MARLRLVNRSIIGKKDPVLGFLDSVESDRLLASYNFLKQVEMSLRLFDMKSVSAFPSEPGANTALARAMGYKDGEEERFIHRYKSVTNSVRESFDAVMQV